MTGTVTGLTGYQWYAGGQWRVMSQLFDDSKPYIGAHLGVGRPGSRLPHRFQCHRLDQRRELRTAVPILSLLT
jgi:hypothetical protein